MSDSKSLELSPTKRNDQIFPEEKKDKKDVEEKGGQDLASLSDCIMLADKGDLWWLALGICGAAVNGVGDPLMMVFFGEGMEELSGSDEMLKAMAKVAIYMTILGVVLHVAATLQYAGMTIFAKRQADRYKLRWFEAVMRQDMEWYDVNDPTEIPGRIASSIPIYEKGVGLKLAEAIQFTVTFSFAVVLGFLYNPYISLFVLGMSPLIVYTGIQIVEVNSKASEERTKQYAKANATSYEVFSSLKTILSFNGTAIFKEKYSQAIDIAEKSGIQRSFNVGWATGSLMSTFIAMYAGITLFGGWMLWYQVKDEGCDPSGAAPDRNACDKFGLPRETHGAGIIIALLCIAFGGQAFGQISTALESVTAARKAIKAATDVIKRVPKIDIASEEGLKPTRCNGNISLHNVSFTYPSRPDTQVMNHTTLNIEAGKTYAFVGESGCGKSTIMQLVQRFYDADGGVVKLDGTDIKSLNVKWLRKQMAIVSQEPKLFSGTIKENIVNGVSAFGISVTDVEIENAAKMANAHDFIMQFPQGYETEVGHGGSQMSGGQKQRIAIARALISNPKILLLDEATSALDNTSERVVQRALDQLINEGNGRTTLVIAHRLSTIRNSDQICYIEKGVVIEQGTHDELMNTQGKYYNLVLSQNGTEETLPLSPTAGSSSEKEGNTSSSSSTSNANTLPNALEVKNPVLNDASTNTPNAPNELARVKQEDEQDKDNEKEKEEEEYKVEFSRIWELNRPDFWLLGVGSLGAVILGPTYPAWGWIFGIMMDIFYTPILPCTDAGPYTPAVLTNVDDNGETYTTCDDYFTYQSDRLKTRCFRVFYAWVVLIVLIQASNVATFWGFGAASEKLGRRIRGMMFDHYLKQEPGYFDMPENSVGEICTRLEKDATFIKSKTGEPIQAFIVFLFGVFGGVVLSLVFCWPIGLMSIATMPVVGAGFALQMSIMMGTDEHKGEDTSGSGAILGEAIGAMKTITSLSLQTIMSEKFVKTVEEKEAKGNLVGGSFFKGNGFGLSFAIMHWNYALLMYFGAWCLVREEWDFTFQDWAISLFAFMFGLTGMAAAGQGATDAKDAKRAIRAVFELLDRDSKINPILSYGTQNVVQGEVHLEAIDFTYPSRPDLKVCNDYNLLLKAGTSVGLVGSSGSGKSTALSLIERFYDPDAGTVKLDGESLPEINYRFLHTQVGYVGQEPVLFGGSIAENIAMGANDTDFQESMKTGKLELTPALMDRVITAAKQANAHAFITAQPDGYNTDVGTSGNTQLSGGQKQRVAIARALISQPKILLFDEATSALDSESEHVVQDAINALIKSGNITCVMIAHRLSTVKDLDMIAVVDKGHIVEAGTHEQLMTAQGAYYTLVNAAMSS